MKKERDRINAQNHQITQDNLSLGVEIDRLRNDPHYIEAWPQGLRYDRPG